MLIEKLDHLENILGQIVARSETSDAINAARIGLDLAAEVRRLGARVKALELVVEKMGR